MESTQTHPLIGSSKLGVGGLQANNNVYKGAQPPGTGLTLSCSPQAWKKERPSLPPPPLQNGLPAPQHTQHKVPADKLTLLKSLKLFLSANICSRCVTRCALPCKPPTVLHYARGVLTLPWAGSRCFQWLCPTTTRAPPPQQLLPAQSDWSTGGCPAHPIFPSIPLPSCLKGEAWSPPVPLSHFCQLFFSLEVQDLKLVSKCKAPPHISSPQLLTHTGLLCLGCLTCKVFLLQ